MKYCSKCGNELVDEAVICPKCGCAVGNVVAKAEKSDNDLLKELADKVKINAVIWIVVGAIQILLGLFVQWWFLIVGVLNIITAINDMNYSKQVVTLPVGVCEKFEPLTMPIITLVYNLIFGGVIGVAGSIYYLVAIRNFVLGNKERFALIEKQPNK